MAGVRLLREFEGDKGTFWREYVNTRGQRVIICARGSGGGRKASRRSTRREAERAFTGHGYQR